MRNSEDEPRVIEPSPELADGDEKFRLLMMGHSVPEDWKTGLQDAPVIGNICYIQAADMIAAGIDVPVMCQMGQCRQRCLTSSSRQLIGGSGSSGRSHW